MKLDDILPLADNASNFRALAALLRRGQNFVPFVGAGLSMPMNYPGWRTYLLQLAADRGMETAIEARLNTNQFEEAAQDLFDAMGEMQFNIKLNRVFGPDSLSDPLTQQERPLHGAVTLLPALARGPVVTTNFDRVLETVFRKAGGNLDFETIVWGTTRTELLRRGLRERRRFLLKLHGDAYDSQDRVLTNKEYIHHYGGQTPDQIDWTLPLPDLLKWLLESQTLLFVGCSLSPDRLMPLLQQITNASGHYALVEMPTDKTQRIQRQDYLFAHKIVPIWYPHGAHNEAIPILLQSLRTFLPDYVAPSSGATAPDVHPQSPIPQTSFDQRNQHVGQQVNVAGNATLNIGTVSAPYIPSSSPVPNVATPSPVLAIWQKKLNFLLMEEAKAVDSAAKFKLQEDIAEARQKIREYGGQV